MTSANSKKGVEYLRDSLLYPLAQNISNIMVFSGLYFQLGILFPTKVSTCTLLHRILPQIHLLQENFGLPTREENIASFWGKYRFLCCQKA
jgi:hypothetical protein